jgi:hypothetical protein
MRARARARACEMQVAEEDETRFRSDSMDGPIRNGPLWVSSDALGAC